MRTLLRVLVIGFAVVIALLAAAAVIGVNNARSIAASASGLVSNQLIIARLLDEVEREQEVLNATFYRLSGTPDVVDRDRVMADLNQTDSEIDKLVADQQGGPNQDAWQSLRRAVLDFSQEARRLLAQQRVPVRSSRDLFSRHEEVTLRVARLVDLSYARAVETRERVDRQSTVLAEESKILLGGCFLVSLIFAIVTVRIAARVFRQMEAQTSELSRVSFRMLETQEATARRFSHELHDELGGSLTAIKSNLAAIASGLGSNGSASTNSRARIDDCVKLVEQSISNVRELSQLLRPTILDDFGLDAGIGWLTDRFRERTGIEAEFKSDFDGRLADETETHLFRIVQEALTNIARHSSATHVDIHLRPEDHRIRLTIRDNGKGLKEHAGSTGMGLIGMRARARSAGGELDLKSQPGKGVTIEAWAPLSAHQTARIEQETT
jgi:signal transduction histidine kinase